jgi:hypothetical protein
VEKNAKQKRQRQHVAAMAASTTAVATTAVATTAMTMSDPKAGEDNIDAEFPKSRSYHEAEQL